MNKIKTIAAFAAASLLTFQSCSDMLDVTNPNSLNDDQIRELLASSDETKVNATLEAIGSGLEAYICLAHQALSGGFSNSYANEFAVHISRNVACENMIYGDVANSITDGWASYYNHTFNAAEKNENASCYGWWYSSSYIIAQANKAATYLTDEVATSPNALPAVKTYAAQAKTLRAYGYLQLMERFRKAYKYGGSEQQGMPIYTKYAYNTPVAPKTAQETWEWIIKELEDAGTYFAAGKNSATDGYTTVNPTDLTTFYDIDRTLSDYYLARACLDYGEYDKAIAACQRILAKYPTLIDEAHYGVQTSRLDDIATPLDDTWKKGKDEVRNDDNAFLSIPSNPEVLFGWTSESNLYSWTILNSLKAGNSKSGLFQISQSLYDKIDDNDYRKGIFADHEIESYPYFTDNGHAASTLLKYTNLKWGATIGQNANERTIANISSDQIILRSSEVLLMLAEAQYQAGKEADAKTTLNKLLAARTKSGAPTLTCDNYKGGLGTWEQIQLQWQIEMWGENGLDYYCHKRWNTDAVRQSGNHWKDYTWKVEDVEWQIPQKELSTNSNWNK